MKRTGCQKCYHPIDFENMEMQSSYPAQTGYTCPKCGRQGKVYSGLAPGFYDTIEEVWDVDNICCQKSK